MKNPSKYQLCKYCLYTTIVYSFKKLAATKLEIHIYIYNKAVSRKTRRIIFHENNNKVKYYEDTFPGKIRMERRKRRMKLA